MLGRKTYTPEELDHAKKAIDRQLAAYKKLAKAAGKDKAAVAAPKPLSRCSSTTWFSPSTAPSFIGCGR